MQQNFILRCTQPPISVVPLSDVSRPLHFVCNTLLIAKLELVLGANHRFGPNSDGTGVIVNKSYLRSRSSRICSSAMTLLSVTNNMPPRVRRRPPQSDQLTRGSHITRLLIIIQLYTVTHLTLAWHCDQESPLFGTTAS